MNRRAFCNDVLLQLPASFVTATLCAREEKIDQAICCLVDASTSMRSGYNFFDLQKFAIATTLRNPCVTQRLLGSDGGRSAFSLIMWASADRQIFAIPWTVIRTAQDPHRLAQQIDHISWPYKDQSDNQTGLGMALFVAAEYMSAMPIRSALRKIINVSSNGENNHGLEPRIVRARALDQSIMINAIIMPGQAPAFELGELEVYYRLNVMTGTVLVTVENGPDAHRDFVDGMIGKFCAELV